MPNPSLPTKKITKIKTDSSNTYDIVAQYMTDSNATYALTAPTLTANSTIATTTDLPQIKRFI